MTTSGPTEHAKALYDSLGTCASMHFCWPNQDPQIDGFVSHEQPVFLTRNSDDITGDGWAIFMGTHDNKYVVVYVLKCFPTKEREQMHYRISTGRDNTVSVHVTQYDGFRIVLTCNGQPISPNHTHKGKLQVPDIFCVKSWVSRYVPKHIETKYGEFIFHDNQCLSWEYFLREGHVSSVTSRFELPIGSSQAENPDRLPFEDKQAAVLTVDQKLSAVTRQHYAEMTRLRKEMQEKEATFKREIEALKKEKKDAVRKFREVEIYARHLHATTTAQTSD